MDTNLQKYYAFLAAVDTGSITRAAEKLNYSQSGVSRMIADLEKEWNLSLVERSHGGVCLTSDGMKLIPFVRNMCEESQRLQTEVDELNGLQSGLIRIGTFSSAATHWLPNIIKAFQKDYPRVDYELLLGDYTEIEEWIRTGRVDIGFLRLPTLPEFETVFLEQEKMMVILPENHPLADCDKFPVEALCDDPFMLLEKGAKAEVSEILERNHIRAQIHFTTWDDYAIMSMVESGLGISIVPQLIVNRLPYRIVAKELNVPAYRDIGVALRSTRTAPVAVKRFMEYIRFR